MLDVWKKKLVLKFHEINVELGHTVSIKAKDYVDSKRVKERIIKNIKESDNLKYESVVNEKGKSFPQVGCYTIDFLYKEEKESIRINVKDTTEPKIIFLKEIEIKKGSDLNDLDLNMYLKVRDYSPLNKWQVDFTKVDINKEGIYDLKVSISDKYQNRAKKTLKIKVIESNKSFPINTIKQNEKNEISNKNEINQKETQKNEKTVENKVSNQKVEKEEEIIKETDQIKKEEIPEKHNHKFNKEITEIVHHEALTHDENIYETHVVCKVCHQDFGKDLDGKADIHSVEFGHSYHSVSVLSGKKEVVDQESYDEKVLIGYACSCGERKLF